MPSDCMADDREEQQSGRRYYASYTYNGNTERNSTIKMEDLESSVISIRPYRALRLDEVHGKILVLTLLHIKAYIYRLLVACVQLGYFQFNGNKFMKPITLLNELEMVFERFILLQIFKLFPERNLFHFQQPIRFPNAQVYHRRC